MPRQTSSNHRKPQVMDADERRSTIEKLLGSFSTDAEPDPRQTSQAAQVIEGKFRESLRDQLRREHYEAETGRRTAGANTRPPESDDLTDEVRRIIKEHIAELLKQSDTTKTKLAKQDEAGQDPGEEPAIPPQ